MKSRLFLPALAAGLLIFGAGLVRPTYSETQPKDVVILARSGSGAS